MRCGGAAAPPPLVAGIAPASQPVPIATSRMSCRAAAVTASRPAARPQQRRAQAARGAALAPPRRRVRPDGPRDLTRLPRRCPLPPLACRPFPQALAVRCSAAASSATLPQSLQTLVSAFQAVPDPMAVRRRRPPAAAASRLPLAPPHPLGARPPPPSFPPTPPPPPLPPIRSATSSCCSTPPSWSRSRWSSTRRRTRSRAACRRWVLGGGWPAKQAGGEAENGGGEELPSGVHVAGAASREAVAAAAAAAAVPCRSGARTPHRIALPARACRCGCWRSCGMASCTGRLTRTRS